MNTKIDFYECECGSIVLNKSKNKSCHRRTLKHFMFLEPELFKKPDLYECECGSVIKYKKKYIHIHNHTKKHKDFIKKRDVVEN